MDIDTQLSKELTAHVSHQDEENLKSETLRYTPAEEKRLIRKLDFAIVPMLMITYAIQYADKAILSSGALFGMNQELGLTVITGTNSLGQPITDNTKYSNVALIFYVGYALGTYPWALLATRFPTAKVCGISILLWSAIVLTTPACKNYAGIMVNRFFLGVTEASVGPAMSVYVSFWWTRQEQVLRTALWYSASGIGSMTAPLINYGLGHITGSLSPWKYMFFVAGAVSTLWGLIIFFFLPIDPVHQKPWFLTEKELQIAVKRMEQNLTGKVHRAIDKKQIFECLRGVYFWSCFILMTGASIPGGSLASFGPIVVKAFGFSSFETLLLTVPMGFTTLLFVIITSYVARVVKNMHYLMFIVCSLITVAGCFICWLGPRSERGVLYFGIILNTAIVGASSLIVSFSGSNVAGHSKKFAHGAGTFLAYCVGNILSQVLYGSTPGPTFLGGFVSSIAFVLFTIPVAMLTYWYLRRENIRRDREYGPPDTMIEFTDMTDIENTNFRYVL